MKNMKKKIAAMLAVVTMMTVGAATALADYGDYSKDTGDEPMYKVGEDVEIYQLPTHIFTWHTKIERAEKNCYGHWEYHFYSAGHTTLLDGTATVIERKN